ncbi:MAG: hypothetical protein M3510_07370 [Actinomycetota bacterium]|nr:hypothetical protein [Actinomycetota bacterium]
MLLLLSIAGAAALAVVAYTRLRSRSPEVASAATRAVRELAAVVLICTKAVESVADTLAPNARTRMASEGLYSGCSRPLVDAWDEEEQ